jgi:hypothetical protein
MGRFTGPPGRGRLAARADAMARPGALEFARATQAMALFDGFCDSFRRRVVNQNVFHGPNMAANAPLYQPSPCSAEPPEGHGKKAGKPAVGAYETALLCDIRECRTIAVGQEPIVAVYAGK